VFVDRDGVLNGVVWRQGGVSSPRGPEELVVEPGAAAAVARLRAAGLPVLVVTNQPDVARGLLAPELLDSMMRQLASAVGFDDHACCPHDDGDACACRKPKAGLLRTLAARWQVDLAASYMIGDTARDVGAGRAAGCTTLLLRRSYNTSATADMVVGTLEQAVDRILVDMAERPAPAGFAARHLAEARQILDALDAGRIEAMAVRLSALRARGGRLFLLGVGGGAAHASHAAADFRKLAGIEAYAASDCIAELTARTNDDGWSSTYAAFLQGSRLRDGDTVLVLSVGGGDAERGVSANIVEALRHAQAAGAEILGIVGRDGGYTATVADCCVLVPVVNAAMVTPHTESFQAIIWHLLVSHPLLQQAPARWESLDASRGATGPGAP
jgi:D-sedoheptulose 7-phosphate isomerase